MPLAKQNKECKHRPEKQLSLQLTRPMRKKTTLSHWQIRFNRFHTRKKMKTISVPALIWLHFLLEAGERNSSSDASVMEREKSIRGGRRSSAWFTWTEFNQSSLNRSLQSQSLVWEQTRKFIPILLCCCDWNLIWARHPDFYPYIVCSGAKMMQTMKLGVYIICVNIRV